MKKIIAIVLSLTMVMGLAACAAGTSQPAPAETQTQASAGGETVFNMSVNFEESYWDPAYFTQFDDAGLAPVIYETLFSFNEDGSVTPCLAESYEVSEDGLTYTIKLRQGVQWHKGYGEFTSEDVKFTLDRQSDPEIASVNTANLNIENIASVECPDKYTVVINLKSIDVDLITRFTMFYSFIVCKAYSDKEGKTAITKSPVGTGPFVFDKGNLAVKTEAVANKDWWGDRKGGNIDRIVNTYIADANTRLSAFENGELDVLPSFDMDMTKNLTAKGYPDKQIKRRDLLYIGMNMSMAPFDDPKVREALFYAIDPQYFVDNISYGTESIPGSYVPSNSKYGLADYFKPSYDPEKAKALLAEAGYPNGLDVEIWGGNDALGEAPVIIAADMLQKSGFNATIQLVDFGVYIEKVRAGEVPIWCFYNSTSAIADDTITRYQSKYYPGNNWSGVCNEEYDRLVDAGVNAATEAEKAENFANAQKVMMDLKVVYPVMTNSSHFLFQKNIEGYEFIGDNAFRATTIIKK